MTDLELVRGVLSGRVDLYAVLVDRHKDMVYAAVRFSLSGRDDEAEDAAQEVFLKAYRSLSQYRGEAAFSTWLYRIALNHLADLHRRRKQAFVPLDTVRDLNAPEDETVSPEQAALAEERRQAIQSALAELPEIYRQVIFHYHFSGLSYAEIGQRLGLPPKTVETRLYRAKRMLREKLEVSAACAMR